MKKTALVIGMVMAAVAVQAADEIVLSLFLQAQKDYLAVSKQVQNLKISMAGEAYDQTVSTYTEATAVTNSPSITTQGVAMFRNLSTTDCAVVTATFLLAPGQAFMGPLATNPVVAGPYTNSSVNVERIVLSK